MASCRVGSLCSRAAPPRRAGQYNSVFYSNIAAMGMLTVSPCNCFYCIRRKTTDRLAIVPWQESLPRESPTGETILAPSGELSASQDVYASYICVLYLYSQMYTRLMS